MGWNGTHSLAVALGLVLSAAGVPVPVSAQGTGQFTVPEGCTAFLTVQSRSCTVAHAWTCDADPEGTHWRASIDENGVFYVSFTDEEFRWLRSWSPRSNSVSTLIEPEEDPASVTELLATGSDTMIFSTITEGPRGRIQRDYTGFDELTGASITVDDEPLEVTLFTYEYETEDGPRRVEGSQFFHRAWRMFFGGIETVTLPSGAIVEANYSPMQFSLPGEPGFLAAEPIFDCGDTMSSLPQPLWRAAQ